MALMINIRIIIVPMVQSNIFISKLEKRCFILFNDTLCFLVIITYSY